MAEYCNCESLVLSCYLSQVTTHTCKVCCAPFYPNQLRLHSGLVRRLASHALLLKPLINFEAAAKALDICSQLKGFISKVFKYICMCMYMYIEIYTILYLCNMCVTINVIWHCIAFRVVTVTHLQHSYRMYLSDTKQIAADILGQQSIICGKSKKKERTPKTNWGNGATFRAARNGRPSCIAGGGWCSVSGERCLIGHGLWLCISSFCLPIALDTYRK